MLVFESSLPIGYIIPMPSRPPRYRSTAVRATPSESSRPTAFERGYDSHWQKLRLTVLAEEPLCRDCSAAGLVVEAVHVDHLIALSKGGTDDRENLVPLCASCHSKKTVREDGGFGRIPPSNAGQ